jgi:hypothetical protein
VKKPDWPGPTDTNCIERVEGTFANLLKNQNEKNKDGRNANYSKGNGKGKGDSKKDDVREKDGLGPGAYTITHPKAGPLYSFGSRFNSSIRSKDHLRPRKVDGPGPGAYKLPSSVKTGSRKDSQFDAMK